MGFITELKRRNIFKVAVAYVALGWVVMQVTDVVVPALNLPASINAIVVYIGIIGFPFALFLAWAFELTPEGVKRTKDVEAEDSIRATTGQKLNYVIIGLLSLAVIFLLIDRNGADNGEGNVTNVAAGSIAVLPFVDMSAAGDQEYFSDGLSEEILNVLAKIPDLRVAARTSSFAYKGQNMDLREIGGTLSVEHILEGSVRKQDSRVRITAQLIRADDGFHVWSETFDRELSDIFVVQEEIANSIAANMALQMDISMTPSLVTNRTENMEAYDLYLEGKMLVSKRGVENVRRALHVLDQATKLDPDYAPAWGMLAQAHALAYYSSEIESTIKGMFLGEEAARRALRIDPNSSHAHGALGDIFKDKYLWQEAEEHYIKALEADPENVEAIEQYGQFFMRTGQFEKALPFVEKARVMHPDGQVYYLVEAMVRSYLGQRERSFELFDQAIEIGDGTSRYPAGTRFLMGLVVDDVDVSKDLLRQLMAHNEMENPPFFNNNLLDIIGDSEKLKEYLSAAYGFFKNNPELINSENAIASTIYAALASKAGEIEIALGFLEIESNLSIEFVDHDFLGTMWAEALAPLRRHPRFKQIMKRYGLVDYWRNNQWAEYCQPIGDDDFECS